MASQLYKFLKKVPLFSELPREDLMSLCGQVKEIELPAGEELFAEGASGNHAYIIQDGELDIIKQSHGQEVLLAVRGKGSIIGEMALLQQAPRMASVRARDDVHLISIGFEQLDDLLNSSPSAARTMLNTVTSRWRATLQKLRRSEKMAQLGNLAAGMAHELNNPAGATQRGAEVMAVTAEILQRTHLHLDELQLSDEQIDALIHLDQQAQEDAASPAEMDTLTRSDREEELEEWLGARGIENAWDLAPNYVNLNLDEAKLEKLASGFSESQFPAVLAWLNESFTIYSLLDEVSEGAKRISEIVNALKSYSYLDQAPVQDVDVHEGLDNTLVLLRNKLKKGVTVQRNYAENLPRITAFGSELNQVWTNIIDNAIQAMNGQGELTISTRQEGDRVVVEICDNGPGIPEEIKERIFDPYFTTKGPGEGTGLGLDISSKIIKDKHRGQISVDSEPGRTCFTVKIPINFEQNHA